MQVIVIFLLVVAVLLVIFTLQNSSDITLNLFFWELHDVPLALLLISCLVLGYLIATFYFWPRLWKSKRELKKLVKFNKELNELQELNKKREEELNHPEGTRIDDSEDVLDSPFFND